MLKMMSFLLFKKLGMMGRIYAGIGSRNITSKVSIKLFSIGKVLANKGYTLRSGGANGADFIFESACDSVSGKKEIFLPWKGFNNNTSTLILSEPAPQEVIDITKSIYNNYAMSTYPVKRLHMRNVYQILGLDLVTPVEFVVCWTDRANTDTGGTMFGVTLAKSRNIPVYNINNFSEEILFYETMM
jgi:hypothetical protein